MKQLIMDMAEKMYSDAYVKRYKPFMQLLTVMQKPKDVQRFIILAKACLTCNAYEELEKVQCPVFVIDGQQDKVVSGSASEEAKDFNKRVFDFLKG